MYVLEFPDDRVTSERTLFAARCVPGVEFFSYANDFFCSNKFA